MAEEEFQFIEKIIEGIDKDKPMYFLPGALKICVNQIVQ